MSFKPVFDQIKAAVLPFARCELGGKFALDASEPPPRYVWVPKGGKFAGATGSGINGKQLLDRNPIFHVYCHGREDYFGAEALLLALPTVLKKILRGMPNFTMGDEFWPEPDGEKGGKSGAVVVVPVQLLHLPVYQVALPTAASRASIVEPSVDGDLVAEILAVQARAGAVLDPGDEP